MKTDQGVTYENPTNVEFCGVRIPSVKRIDLAPPHSSISAAKAAGLSPPEGHRDELIVSGLIVSGDIVALQGLRPEVRHDDSNIHKRAGFPDEQGAVSGELVWQHEGKTSTLPNCWFYFPYRTFGGGGYAFLCAPAASWQYPAEPVRR